MKVFLQIFKIFRKGLCVAQETIGTYYFHGLGCERDLSIAITWWRKAAKQGNESSANNLSNYASNQKKI